VFTRAPNRGIAEIVIDGERKSTVDLYSPTVEWQSKAEYCCLAKGRHTIEVRVTGKRSKDATVANVDLDSFVVD
jgi:hypothetical protein